MRSTSTSRSPTSRRASSALFWPYFPANTTAMATQVSLFLCPSDGAPPPAVGTGPTNYAFCSGDGSNGGDATNANGAFILGPAQSVASLTDGTSQTAAASEQIAGDRRAVLADHSDAGARALDSSDGPRRRRPAHRSRLRLGRQRLAAQQGFLSWWDGNYQNALYNHYLTPNANRPDCIVYHNPGWKAARSFHPGGVNVLYCDGHVVFAKDTVDLRIWRAIATRAGGEVISADAL